MCDKLFRGVHLNNLKAEQWWDCVEANRAISRKAERRENGTMWRRYRGKKYRLATIVCQLDVTGMNTTWHVYPFIMMWKQCWRKVCAVKVTHSHKHLFLSEWFDLHVSGMHLHAHVPTFLHQFVCRYVSLIAQTLRRLCVLYVYLCACVCLRDSHLGLLAWEREGT